MKGIRISLKKGNLLLELCLADSSQEWEPKPIPRIADYWNFHPVEAAYRQKAYF